MSLSLYVGPDSQPDKYRLVRSVGRGGEATLYLAEVTLAGQTEPVVVKALNADITADSAQFAELSARWAEQAELLRFINRLGVVGVREHFEGAPEHPRDGAGEQTDRCLYLVMNHIDGLDLRDWRAEHAQEGVRGQREVLRYLEQVAQVLDMLHAGRATPSRRPVVHGDLSPGNIMIDTDGQATLVDFGLSRIAARHMTARPWFTPGYAAPEIFSGEYSPATDRYAFGAVAFYTLTGEDPPTAPEQLRERFAALPLLADADERARALVVSMFSAEPAERPEAATWVGALRTLATSVPWTGPGSDPAGDPGTSAVFAASLFSAAAEDTGSTAGIDPSVLPQGPAVAGPPPTAPGAPQGPGGSDASGGQGTDATVVLSPTPAAGTPASHAPQAPDGSPGAPVPTASSATPASGAAQAPGGSAGAPVPGAPSGTPGSGSAQASGVPAVADGGQGTDATVVLSPTPAAGMPAPGAPHASAVSPGAPAPETPSASSAPGVRQGPGGSDASGGQGTDATVVLSPTPAAGTPASGAAQAPGGSVGAPVSSASGVSQGPGGSAGAPAPEASSAGHAPGAPQGAGGSGASGGQGTDATAVLSPTPASGTPAASSDTESTVVLPGNEPGAEDMPYRPVGGLRGRPVQQRPTSGPPQQSTPPAAAPAGPPPGRPGRPAPARRPTPPGGTARPPMPPPGSGPLRSGPMPSGPAYGGPPPPVHSGPAYGGPPPPAGTGAFPAYGHQPTPEPPARRKKSRKPLLIGLAAFAVLCMVGGSVITYTVMDRGLPFLADGPQQVAAEEPGESPAASETEEAAPPMAAEPGEKPEADASAPDGDPDAPAPGDTTLLTQMEIVDNHQDDWLPGTGRAELDGEAYTRALVATECGGDYDRCTGWADYNLGRNWSAFTATIGVDDTSSASATTTFTVHVDGEPEVTETLRLGETMDIEVDVRDVLRLRIEVESDDGGVYPVWADPTLTA